ncbi:MAG TPA: type 1 glutamine amidotransferase domain-containing protein [Polyangia bacterium]|nr:type 1 glutamine amidotransferase domain-containing protein [Polyangia bacterium]
MTKILMLVSSARVIRLADGTPHATGYFVEEAIKPYDRFVAAGVEVVVATSDGQTPHPDPYGLEHYFHYPDDDEDFLASVTRTFRRDVDDIRITLQHLTELDLIAARRVHGALRAAGLADREARALVARAARTAWSRARNYVEVLAADPEVTSRVPASRLSELAGDVKRESEAIAASTLERLTNNPVFKNALELGALSDAQILAFDGVFIPGGHGPMVDMANNLDVGRMLRLFHAHRKTIACLCHGPAALLSAGETPSGRWLFDGYKLTCFTDEEESQTRVGLKGMPWYVETALKNAGAVFDHAPLPWTSHVVVDRHLITSQNPMSSDAAADAVLQRLGLSQRSAA